MDERYKYQYGLPGWGDEGQMRLAHSRVACVGLGGLGSHSSLMLARAGVGGLFLADPDTVEITNIHRQSFTEEDAYKKRDKVSAIVRQVIAINPDIEYAVANFTINSDNCWHLHNPRPVSLILDGLDNWEGRYALNDFAVTHGIPFVYAGVSGVMGMVYPILPKTERGDTPWEKKGIWTKDLRTLFPNQPKDRPTDPSKTPISLGPLLPIVANLQVIEALKILIGNYEAVNRNIVSFNAWEGKWREIDVNR
jgi:adenylyltransferase/sulfurtransferase